ncbi:MAG: hypothetical protein E3J64_05540 [Anaerolineales bacterium]|nr:MAG: hypothetical protein E3J64_05540 [Anaerolineales bacterium]
MDQATIAPIDPTVPGGMEGVVGKRFSARAAAYLLDLGALYGLNYVAGSVGGFVFGVALGFINW